MDENDSKEVKDPNTTTAKNSIDIIQLSNVIVPTEKLPRLYKLNIDCLEEIFEYLSTRDLLALGQTCKTMQQVIGEYFKVNYTAATKFGGNYGIYRVFSGDGSERAITSGFNQFVRYISHNSNSMAPLRYIKSNTHRFGAVNHLLLDGVHLTAGRIDCIQKILNKLEIIQIKQCSLQFDFYECFLQFCQTVQRLYIQDDFGEILIKTNNEWLQKSYPALEHLELIPLKLTIFDVNELEQFFQNNPNVCSFSTSLRFLWKNKDKFVACKIALDTLTIKITRFPFLLNGGQERSIVKIFHLLNQLYKQKFYQHLNLHVTFIDAEYTNEMLTLHGLKRLCIIRFPVMSTFNLYRVINLKELAIMNTPPEFDMETLAHGLINLEQLYLCNATFSNLLPFIRYSVKLNRIVMKDEIHLNENIFNVRTLNNQRKMLKNPHKLTIYVSDELFIATKWATTNGVIDLKFIKIQRCDSYRWDHYYQ